MPISDWPENERPREKLLAQGAGSLSDAELLAIFLRVGVRGMSAVDLGRTLIREFGSLGGLFAADPAALASVPGIGPAKSAQLKAALEIAARALREQARERDALASPAAVRDFLRLTLSDREHEVFVAVLLDAQNRVIHVEELFRGTLTQTSVYPREVVKCALRHNAAAVIFAHNHPSGIAEPSHADKLLTDALRKALDTVDVKVLDHFVVGAGGGTSFAERGLL
ncbi:MAG: DNA repair protein RadC [Burkholderiales bacterium]|jgi:DNA repair protein RadC|nr:DNA repair protein RadC [Burkholderiales bacterium]